MRGESKLNFSFLFVLFRHFLSLFPHLSLPQLAALVEYQYPKLTDMFFANHPWPTPAAVQGKISPFSPILNLKMKTLILFFFSLSSPAELLNCDDDLFIALYGELYYRNLYTKHHPTPQQRVGSTFLAMKQFLSKSK